MNNLTRSLIILTSGGICLGAFICTMRPSFGGGVVSAKSFGQDVRENGDYRFAADELGLVNYGQLESVVRADVAARYPNTRVELGSVTPDRAGLTMNVVLFGPNRKTEAFVYTLVPEKNSWKIARSHRVWFVPASQLARGLQV
jgi:hypothetical protein